MSVSVYLCTLLPISLALLLTNVSLSFLLFLPLDGVSLQLRYRVCNTLLPLFTLSLSLSLALALSPSLTLLPDFVGSLFSLHLRFTTITAITPNHVKMEEKKTKGGGGVMNDRG